MPDAAGPKIVIAGTREDWPGGAQTLDAARPHPGTQRADPLVRGRARRGRQPAGVVPDHGGGRRPDAGEDPPRPRRQPHRRPPRLADAGPSAAARTQPLRGPGLRSRRHVDRTSAVVKMDSSARRRPPAGSPRPRSPRTPAARTPGRSAGSDACRTPTTRRVVGRGLRDRRGAGFAGAEVPSILSTSFNALIPHPHLLTAAVRGRRPLRPITCAASGPSSRGGGRRVCHGAPATTAQDHSVWRFSISRYNTCNASS